MRCVRIIGILLLAAAAGAEQPLPKEVVTLARIKTRARDELARLPNYTCLQTVSRFHREKQNAKLEPLDTVRLEIVYSDHHEWYSSPGDKSAGADEPANLVGSGMIGSGMFASSLNNILAAANFQYEGKEEMNGRAAVKYSFVFPRASNVFRISIPGGSGTVGERGFLWADEQTLDLIRLESNADEIPDYLPLTSLRTVINYAAVRIGDRTTLLGQSADTDMVRSGGVRQFNRTEYSHCRAFTTETALRFDDGSGGEPPVQETQQSQPAKPAAIPALLAVTIHLATPVTNQDTVGQLIEGRVGDAVVSKGKVVIPRGALVRGRIRRLEHYDARTFIVGLEFTEVETAAGSQPFYADLLRMDNSATFKQMRFERVVAGDATITLPELPGVASFFAEGASFTIPAGFSTVWRTRGPIRGM